MGSKYESFFQNIHPSLIHDEGHIDVSCHKHKAWKEKANHGSTGKSGGSSLIEYAVIFLRNTTK